MKFAVYTSIPGPILRTISCPLETVEFQTQEGESIIIISEETRDDTHYIDGASISTPYPAQPFDYYIFDFPTETWINPRPLDEAKVAIAAALLEAKRIYRYAPLVTPYGTFVANAVGQSDITGAIQASDKIVERALPFPEPLEASVEFTLLDDSQVTLDNEALSNVGLMLAARISALYTSAAAKLIEIDACTTEEELAAITWLFNDPEYTPTLASAEAAALKRIYKGLKAANEADLTYGGNTYPMHSEMLSHLSAWALEARVSIQESEASFVNTLTDTSGATHTLDQSATLALFRAHQARNRTLTAHSATLQADVVTAAAITPEADAITALDAIVWTAP